jgi:hypothetical protein
MTDTVQTYVYPIAVGFVVGVAIITFTEAGLLALDWDEILMICTGLAAFGYVIADAMKDRRFDRLAVEFAERIARLEANNDDGVALEGRLAVLGERVAILETKIDGSEE